MTEREAFLRAILEDPADDTPRLAFADWLTDQGEGPRAEFIRVQVELRQYPLAIEEAKPGGAIPATKRYGQLRTRERELLLARNDGGATNRWAWGHHVSHLIGEPWSADSVQFRRGFVESVTLTAADFLRHAEALFRAQPITRVTLSDRDAGGAYHDGAGIAFVRRQPSDTRDSPDTLPDVLFDRLVSPESANFVSLHVGDSVGWIELKYFPDAADARDALSDSCVAHGRELAGLPPLPAPSPEARRRADA
jgi:uncharacterized protein (TIGR02996 family)